MLFASFHSEPMLTGEMLYTVNTPREWFPTPPDTPVETILQIVCR